MIPVSLRLKGVYSYSEEAFIDFERLSEAHIFGIFGSVGSGKSTILEAISFSLYGDSERLNKKDNRNYNMMNLRSDRLEIEYVFKSGNPEKRYRAVVKGRRNGKQFAKVPTLDRVVYERDADEWIPLENSSAEEMIGLSYENFKRTIIIPQGKFQEFLTLTAKDRTQMLREIFSLQKYELFRKTAQLKSDSEKKEADLNGRLQELGSVAAGDIDEVKESIAQIEKSVLEKKEKLDVLIKKRTEFDELLRLIEKVEGLTKNKAELDKDKSSFEKLARDIEVYEFCLREFRDVLVEERSSEKQLKGLNGELKNTKEKQERLHSDIETQRECCAKVKKRLETLPDERVRLQDYDLLLKIKNYESDLKEAEARLRKGEVLLREKEDSFLDVQKNRDELRKKVEDSENLKYELSELLEIQAWFQKKEDIVSSRQENDVAVDANQNALTELKRREIDIYSELSEDAFSRIKKADSGKDAFAHEYALVQERITDLQKERDKEIKRSGLCDYADSLRSGAACPLCGATEHPAVLKLDDVNEELARIERDLKHANEQREFFSKVERSLDALNVEHKALIRESEKLQKERKELELSKDKHHQLFKWGDFNPDDAKSFSVFMEDFRESAAEQKSLRQELKQIESDYEKARETIDNYRNKINELKTHKDKNLTLVKAAESDLQFLKVKDFAETGIDAVEEQKNALYQRIESAEKEYVAAQDKLTVMEKEQVGLAAEVKALTGKTQELESRLQDIATRIASRLEASPVKNKAQADDILSVDFDLESERKRVQDYNHKCVEVDTSLKACMQTLGDREYSEKDHLDIVKSVDDLSAKLDEERESLGRQKHKLDELKKSAAKAKDLKKELSVCRKRLDNLKVLLDLFRGSGFVNYVSTIYLRMLCDAANKRFQSLTRQTMSLELADDNSFQVRDYLNGGEVRSVKTLSGGETFQASLSLAIALSDSIQSQAEISKRFFFLDEGFGSQDRQSLEKVFAALRSLRKENRIIGLISHVEELQQEISTYLRLEKDEKTGSRVVCSWE